MVTSLLKQSLRHRIASAYATSKYSPSSSCCRPTASFLAAMIVLSGSCLLLHTLLFLDLREGRFVMGQFGMEWSQYCDINMSSYRGKAGVNLILPDRPQAAPSLLSYLFTLSGCKWDINDVTSMAMLTYSAVTLGWLLGNSRGNQSTSGKVGIVPNHWRKNWILCRVRWPCPRLKRWASPQITVPSPSAPPESKSLSWLGLLFNRSPKTEMF